MSKKQSTKEFMEEQYKLQKKEMDEQDRLLDLLSSKMDVVKNMASDFNFELKKQDKQLKNLQYQVDKASFTVKKETKRVEKLTS